MGVRSLFRVMKMLQNCGNDGQLCDYTTSQGIVELYALNE